MDYNEKSKIIEKISNLEIIKNLAVVLSEPPSDESVKKFIEYLSDFESFLIFTHILDMVDRSSAFYKRVVSLWIKSHTHPILEENFIKSVKMANEEPKKLEKYSILKLFNGHYEKIDLDHLI